MAKVSSVMLLVLGIALMAISTRAHFYGPGLGFPGFFGPFPAGIGPLPGGFGPFPGGYGPFPGGFGPLPPFGFPFPGLGYGRPYGDGVYGLPGNYASRDEAEHKDQAAKHGQDQNKGQVHHPADKNAKRFP